MNHLLIPLFFLLIFHSQIPKTTSQQSYVNNNQLDCTTNYTNTNGYLCNNPNTTSCTSYLTFRSYPPYTTLPNIAFLLNSNPSEIARINNISDDVGPINPPDRLLLVPVPCSCTTPQSQSQSQSQSQTANRTAKYYQHNANYTIKTKGETYFTMANNTYQGLTTCQAMMGQNRIDPLNLEPGDKLTVPLMCACPTKQQEKKYGAKYLVSYIVTWGDDVSKIAAKFGVDMQSVLDANELKVDDVVYPFTPILVPVKTEPLNLNLNSSPPAPSSPTLGPTTPKSPGGSSRKWVYVGIGIGGGVLGVCLCSLFFWFCCCRTSKNPVSKLPKKDQEESAAFAAISVPVSYTNSNTSTTTQQIPNTKSWSMDLDFKSAIGSSLKVYKFSELQQATGKFSEGNRIKGSVYRGEFNGDEAAVKILKGNVSNDEISLLKHINHANIIRLSGYCVNEGNTYLVYEFADNGSLDDWLFDQKKFDLHQVQDHVLGWKQRVQIACNVADALSYLHSYVNPPYIHKNMKSSNVLLDNNYRAKITNFGLARTVQDEEEGGGVVHLTKHVVGTHGYLAPEYIENGVVTPKLDVFAFGVVLLELLSGKPAVRPNNNNKGVGSVDDLLFLVIRNVFEGEDVREKLTAFMDNKLHKEYPLDLAYSMAQLAYKCVDRDMNSRPSMPEVSMTLSKIYSSSLDWDPSDELMNSSSTYSYSR